MADLEKMDADQLEFEYRQELIAHPDCATSRYLALRRELLRRLGSAGQGEPKSRFDLTVKLWNEYRKNRILPAFDTLALDYQLFAQYVVGHFTTAPAEKEG